MNTLLSALDNEKNSTIMNLDYKTIKKMKNDILQQLQIKGEDLKKMHEKLKNYRYIDTIDNLNIGGYVRWINLKKLEKQEGEIDFKKILTNGAIICDWKILDNCIHIVCKTNQHRIIQLNFDENLLFQKLTEQEEILLSVIKYLNN